MKITSIETLSREKCLAIAKVIFSENNYSDAELLDYLPDDIFGKLVTVLRITNESVVVHDLDNSKIHWYIPFYFCCKKVDTYI